jgi:transcriptional regulator GlxA family with amidase domain
VIGSQQETCQQWLDEIKLLIPFRINVLSNTWGQRDTGATHQDVSSQETGAQSWCVGGQRERTVRFGVFVYEGVEPIDLATFGVLSMARRVAPQIEIVTVAPQAGVVRLSNGLEVIAQHSVGDAPGLDVLIVTGGPGWPDQTRHEPTLAYLRRCAAQHVVASVCTGGMILAAAGVLDGHRATTKQAVIAGQETPPLQLMAERHPAVQAVSARLIDDGAVITGGGVSLCIDLTLHLLQRLLGDWVASETARILEYGAAWSANQAHWDAGNEP